MFRQTTRHLRWMQVFVAASFCLYLSGCGGGEVLSSGSNSQTATLRGRIVRADNPSQGIANAVVTLSRSNRSGTMPLFTTRTDTQGIYVFHNIPSGEYVIEAAAPDGSYQPIQVPVRVEREDELDLNLTPSDAQVDRIEIIPPPTDAPGDAYTIGRRYEFEAHVYDKDGNRLDGWQPNWRVIGGVGSINSQGQFYAASAGTGEVVAYLYSDGQMVESRKPIRVSDAAGEQRAPWILLPYKSPNGWGFRAVDVRTKQERRFYGLNLPSLKTFTIDDEGGVVYAYGARTIVRLQLETGDITPFSIPSYDVQRMVALGDDRILLYSSGRFSVYDGRNGDELYPWTPVELTQVNHMALGPDRRIYCTGRIRDASRSINGMVCYRMEGDIPVWDATLVADNRIRRGIAFAANGDMVVCEDKTIQAYTTSGVRLGRGLILPFSTEPNTIHAGHSVLKAYDLVFFVGTRKGIWRVRYDGNTFSLFPEDAGSPFLPMNTDTGFLVWNNPK